MADPRYCSKCGTQLRPTSNFCPTCGKAVPKAAEQMSHHPESPRVLSPAALPSSPPSTINPKFQPAPQDQVPAPSIETVVGIIPGATRHSGFIGIKTESFIVVLTNMRIIFAAQTSEMMQANIKRAKDEAKQQGKGFFGQWGAQFGANSGHRYLEIPLQQILAEQPTNFYITRDQLQSVRVWESSGDEDAVSTYYMEFRTAGGKHKFTFGQLNVRDLKKQLQNIYGNIVR